MAELQRNEAAILKFTGAHPLASKPGVDDRAEGGGGTAPSFARPSVYLGLDQDSRRLAYARGFLELWPGRGGKPITGTRNLPPWMSLNGCFDPGVPLSRVEDFIFDQVLEHGVTHVFSEATYIGPTTSTETIFQLFTVAGAVATACIKAKERCGRSVYWRQFTPMEWRKEFIGSKPGHLAGKDEKRAWYKEQALERCWNRGWPVESEHEAEAAGLLNYGLCVNYPEYAQAWLPLIYARRHS